MANARPMPKKERRLARWTECAAERTTCFISGHWGTLIALGILIVWLIVTISTGVESVASDLIERFFTMTSLVLLFILQRSVTKDTEAMQIKLNELLNAMGEADSSLTKIDELDEEEIARLHERSKQGEGAAP